MMPQCLCVPLIDAQNLNLSSNNPPKTKEEIQGNQDNSILVTDSKKKTNKKESVSSSMRGKNLSRSMQNQLMDKFITQLKASPAS